MKLTSENWAVYTANTREPKIDPKPPYQRGPVWSLGHQQLFIDSLLRSYDIPKLYLRTSTKEEFEWEVIDGKQRLQAIWRYLGGDYHLSPESDPVDGHRIASKHFKELHHDLHDEPNLSLIHI